MYVSFVPSRRCLLNIPQRYLLKTPSSLTTSNFDIFTW
jgi:hypothetical protein